MATSNKKLLSTSPEFAPSSLGASSSGFERMLTRGFGFGDGAGSLRTEFKEANG